MFKKIFKAATVFSMLVGCYLGYVQLFAIVVHQMTTTHHTTGPTEPWEPKDSASLKRSIELAKEVMPPGHWATRNDLNFRYYSGERGYWMYAQDMEQVQEENGVRYDGKRLRLKPFLVISKSRDGKKIQTITSDRAVIDLNQALGFSSTDGEPLKVKHIRLEPNAVICDNKGTPDDPKDDMVSNELTNLEFDDPTQRISSESHVVITDGDMITSGDGMLIQLGKSGGSTPGASSGFDGVEWLELLRNVHVILRDVGKSGIIPGKTEQARPANGAKVKFEVAGGPEPTAQTLPEQQPTPLHLTCDSKMRVFPAKTRAPVLIGPPAPPAPTVVTFDRNVVVLRGKVDEQPGQLTCDSLRLTLLPSEVPPPRPAASPENKDDGSPAKTAANDEKSGLFGGLVLNRVHATGHAVWLYLPVEGIKLRCNELIHTRQAPEKPDLTYFRGDATRPLQIEKIDLVEDVDHPDRKKVKSITHIVTVDATMYDKGFGFDSADIDASGPGRLDTQPDRGQPVDRTAIWQDKLKVQNDVDSGGRINKKIIVLTGNRPVFIDNSRASRIDSAQSINVLLMPKLVSSPKGSPTLKENQSPAGSIAGGSGFDIKRLLAFQDVHLLQPGKTMTARKYLDAEFTHPLPAPAIAAAPASSSSPANAENATDQPPAALPPTDDQVAAKDEEVKKQPSEPPMVGSADRIWVEIEMTPKPPAQKAGGKEAAQTRTASSTTSGTDVGDSQSEIRKAWLMGSVAIHQDPAEGKTKGQDASGEALYLDNPAKNQAITLIFQREPNEKVPLPGPLPPARVENDEKTIIATGGDGVIKMNQRTDEAWVEGPGMLSQLSPRAASPPAAEPSDASSKPGETSSPGTSRTSSGKSLEKPSLAHADPDADLPEKVASPKPQTRAGRLMSEKVLSRIYFSEGMEFHGKSIDPDGNPAGRADFFGVASALLEDALLRGEEGIIAYTDRPVPFAQLGALSKPKSRDADPALDRDNSDKPADDGPQLAIIECYRNAVGISRKVDPDRPQILQQQRIEASQLLVYDRRTGNFHVPGKGRVFLYDRSDNSRAQGLSPKGDLAPDAQPAENSRNVIPASNRNSAVTTRSTAPPSATNRNLHQDQPADAGADPKAGELPPLVLTQIGFVKGMRGRFGSTSERDPTEVQWYEFFGDIQLARAKIANPPLIFNYDKLPADNMFLTSQTLRFRTEPPPVGSPPSTPARDYMKAWDHAQVRNSQKAFDADVVTYDSEKDLIYAYGEGGRGVNYVEQVANGQPYSQGLAKAVQINPRTGAAHFVENASVQLIDKNSGARPGAAAIVDPDYKQKKRPKKGFRIPSSNIERRGFTGQ